MWLAACAVTPLPAASYFLLSLSVGGASPVPWEFACFLAVCTTSESGVTWLLIYSGSSGHALYFFSTRGVTTLD